jgi:hypothetical protein
VSVRARARTAPLAWALTVFLYMVNRPPMSSPLQPPKNARTRPRSRLLGAGAAFFGLAGVALLAFAMKRTPPAPNPNPEGACTAANCPAPLWRCAVDNSCARVVPDGSCTEGSCGEGMTCSGGQCVPSASVCTSAGDCAARERCLGGECVNCNFTNCKAPNHCDALTGACVACDATTCKAPNRCDPVTGACAPDPLACKTTSDCAKGQCLAGECVTCSVTNCTPPNQCDDSTGICAPIRPPEVYFIHSPNGLTTTAPAAGGVAQRVPGRSLATRAQVVAAQAAGARWGSSGITTTAGWAVDNDKVWSPPIYAVYLDDTGVVKAYNGNLPRMTAGVTVYGVKPTSPAAARALDDYVVLPFSPQKWSQFSTPVSARAPACAGARGTANSTWVRTRRASRA